MSSSERLCPACGSTCSAELVPVNTRPRTSSGIPPAPYFPCLLMLNGAQPDEGGFVGVCPDCSEALHTQWTTHSLVDRQLEDRRYWLASCQTLCEFCGQLVFLRQSGVASGIQRVFTGRPADWSGTARGAAASVTLPSSSQLVLHTGIVCTKAESSSTAACHSCAASLAVQDRIYNDINVPAERRHYRGRCAVEVPVGRECCFICGNACDDVGQAGLRLRSQPCGGMCAGEQDGAVTFSFLGHLMPAAGASLPEQGSVRVCRACYSHFAKLWQQVAKQDRAAISRSFSLDKLLFPVAKPTPASSPCFLCVERHSIADLVEASAYPTEGTHPGAFFPFLATYTHPKHSAEQKIGEDGRAKVCVPCWRKLLTEWMDFSQKGVHLCQRHYTIAGGSSEAASNGQQSSTATLREVVMTLGETTDTSAATPADFSVVVPNSQFCCFVCGAPRPLAELKVLRTTAKSTRTGQAAEMLLPCLTQLDCAPGASGLNEHDGAQCCQLCFDDLKLQWDGFEHVRVPLSGRSFIVLRGLWSAGDSQAEQAPEAPALGMCTRRRKSLQPRKRLWKDDDAETVPPKREKTSTKGTPTKQNKRSSRGSETPTVQHTRAAVNREAEAAEKDALLKSIQANGEKQRLLQAEAQCVATQLVAAVERRGRLATVSEEIHSSIEQMQEALSAIVKVVSELTIHQDQPAPQAAAVEALVAMDVPTDARLISSTGLQHMSTDLLPPIGMQTEVVEMVI